MASLAELARFRTDLDSWQVDHLQRLVASWSLLADLCFSDLLLFAPVEPTGEHFIVLGQVRPATSQTLYRADWIARVLDADQRPLVSRGFHRGEIIEGELTDPGLREPVRVLAVPVRCDGVTVGVLTKESAPSVGRQTGELERSYVEVFNRFARMITEGEFPYPGKLELGEEAPRVGDGVVLLDGGARVSYASPNAVSALHRVGVHGAAEGMRFAELGLEESAVDHAFADRRPATEEIERGPEVTVVVKCYPLLERREVTGGLVLVRDISELRRRDRLLVSKDATIREIHHRVKNNLQTISSLLRLQGRRLSSPEAKAAVEESVRRIRSIALVHETLAHQAGDDVSFGDILRPLVRMVEEGLTAPEQPVAFEVSGDPGTLPADIATPLAVVLTELLQNAVDHAYADGDGSGRVEIALRNDGATLTVTVTDDGVGLPEGFALDASPGLGLSIVRTLVTSELAGTITMRSGPGGGTRPGAVVELVIPLAG